MSIQLGSLVSHILSDHFGDIVEKVGSDLYRFGSKTIPLVNMTTNLPKSQIKKSLCTLIKYGLATFQPSKSNSVPEYTLCKENILLLLNYPKYILHIKNKYGSEAEMIIEEMLQEGASSAVNIILSIMARVKEDKEKSITVVSLRDTLISLITAKYVCHAAVLNEGAEDALVPTFKYVESTTQLLPEFDIRAITAKIDGDASVQIKDDSLWKVNFDRFHQDFRDDLFIEAMTRSIDECGGELMRLLLQMMYLDNDPWAPKSKPIPFVDLKDYSRKSSKRPLLIQYLEQYLSVMEEGSDGIVSCTGGASGGQYTLKLARASELLVWDLLYLTVQERLGTKAARIFRLIKTKKYIEEEGIQRNAMLPAKEAKQLTYKLLEEHFIEIQGLRKSTSASAGPSKVFYLYYIDLNNVASMLLETTYKALFNIISRRQHEKSINKWMIDKQQRVDTIVHSMRLRGEPEENILDIEETVTPPEKLALEKITLTIKKLSSAEIHLCETVFILQMFFIYKQKK